MNCFRPHLSKARTAFQRSRESAVMTISSSDIPASGSATAAPFVHRSQGAFRRRETAIAMALRVKRSVKTSQGVRSDVFAARPSTAIPKNHNPTGIIKC